MIVGSRVEGRAKQKKISECPSTQGKACTF